MGASFQETLHEGSSSGGVTGVMVALITPLDGSGDLDESALERHSKSLLNTPITGLCPAGSTGEGPLLSRALRVRLVEQVVSLVGTGTVSVVPATVSVSLAGVLEELEAYGVAGATHALVSVPFYYPLDDRSVLSFYEGVSKESPIPILIYNIPQMTKVSVAPWVVKELAGFDNIAGMKDSSGTFEYFESVLGVTRGITDGSFALLTGSDTMLLASTVMGGSGTICASANLVPELVCDLFEATKLCKIDEAKSLQFKLLNVVLACRKAGYPSGWKAGLSLKGMCSLDSAAPLQPAASEAIERLKSELVILGVL